jgi:hypothetical protein
LVQQTRQTPFSKKIFITPDFAPEHTMPQLYTCSKNEKREASFKLASRSLPKV